MKFLSKLTFDQKIIAYLTAIIAVAAIVQAASAMYQTNLFAESEARNRQREQPNVKIFPHIEPFVETHGDGEVPKSYVGFDIVNRSPFEVTIERIGLTKAWPIDQNLDATKSVQLPYLTKNDVSDMSDVLLPKRLSYGEISMKARRKTLTSAIWGTKERSQSATAEPPARLCLGVSG